MRNASRLQTIAALFIISSSMCSANLCPHNRDVTNQIETLAKEGKATVGKDTYHLIGRDQTSIYFTEQLLENDTQLNGFLTVSKLLDKNLPRPEAHLIALLPNPNFCAYKIAFSEDNYQVIALSSDS